MVSQNVIPCKNLGKETFELVKKMDKKDNFDNGYSDPSNWKWGIFYFNKDDKRIFPPKRNKYAGWTVNFANLYSIIALIVLIILMKIIAKYLIET